MLLDYVLLFGIDLILEEGMNVKVCSFPDLMIVLQKTSYDDLVAYLDENAKDFIHSKLLFNEGSKKMILSKRI
jgi:DNA primase